MVTTKGEPVGITQIAKANLVDDPCIKIQLQTEYRIYVHIFYIKYFFMR